MSTMTLCVNDKRAEIFRDEENKNNDLLTSSIRYTTISEKTGFKQKAQLIGDLQAETLVIEEGVDFVENCNVNPVDEIEENKYSGGTTYISYDETSDEGNQSEIESHEDSYNKTHSTNEERIKLLARKYIRRLSNEENARLEMLCERVRQLFPRVTADDFAQLEKIGTELKDFEEENKRIREKYNLD